MGKDAHSVIDKKSLKVEQKEWLTLKPAVYWGWCAILEREFACLLYTSDAADE